ncbi:MAG: arylesterase [Rhodobiaceae bacterium]|nr:arylesterase [Rhodobiaceae bacterium]MCC0012495.1 arylesterase [Rhodobiaceae bacterium]MCC0019280.1 arylesterase [Rhodobiaceae bacterium]MCC0051966.1 arylesterase [Rhodobiaceae bacterium]MCC0061702.1 arylesterase [Rhodobiaceae bacterium]
MWIAPARAESLRLVAFGDSLTAGLGLDQSDAYPAQLEKTLKAKGYDVAIANAGVSGDTASAAAQRIDWSVPDGTDGVIIALGGNDILRGIDPAITRKAMTDIIMRLKQRGIPVLLAGMQASANLGADFAKSFDAIFPELAGQHGLVFMPFFLEGVATDPALNQPDGIHPNREGVAVIVDNIFPYAVELIERSENSG